MKTQPDHYSGELIPRPERTPTALRQALAVVAPDRLPEMQAEQNQTLTEAVRSNSLDPVRGFLLRWAVVVEIERFPDTANNLHRAEYLAQVAHTPEESLQHVRTCGEIVRATYQALSA